MFTYIFWEITAAVVGAIAVVLILLALYRYQKLRAAVCRKSVMIPVALLFVAFVSGLLANRTYSPQFAMPTWMHSHAPGGLPASIPFGKIVEFFLNRDQFERVDSVGADPNAVPSLTKPDQDGVVRVSLVAQEVIAEVAPGIYFNFWTYNKQVPGPMLHIKEGDTVEISLSNHASSLHEHNIDLHAVTGPGGGAQFSRVAPGETKAFRWRALNPGLYVYHCAMPNVSTHNSHGQYGLILVEPKEGLSKVDKEFYVMQGELYTSGKLGKKGLVPFDAEALLDGHPNYVTFNGLIEQAPRMRANVGERVRIYVGNGGVNLVSSFHVIGEIFDTVYPEAAMGPSSVLLHNVQTTTVLPGGAAVVEFTVDYPGKYLLVDHALARMNKGAWAVLEVDGEADPDIIRQIEDSAGFGEGRMEGM